MKLLMALVLSATLTACSMMPTNTQEGLAAAYLTVDTLAQTIGHAQLSGAITEAKEDMLLDKLAKAMEYLTLAREADVGEEQSSYLRMALVVLTSVEEGIK